MLCGCALTPSLLWGEGWGEGAGETFIPLAVIPAQAGEPAGRTITSVQKITSER